VEALCAAQYSAPLASSDQTIPEISLKTPAPGDAAHPNGAKWNATSPCSVRICSFSEGGT